MHFHKNPLIHMLEMVNSNVRYRFFSVQVLSLNYILVFDTELVSISYSGNIHSSHYIVKEGVTVVMVTVV